MAIKRKPCSDCGKGHQTDRRLRDCRSKTIKAADLARADAPAPRARVLITVQGGLIQDVSTDVDVDVLIYDWDNIKDNVECGVAEFAVTVGPRAWDKLKREQDAEVKRVHDEMKPVLTEDEKALFRSVDAVLAAEDAEEKP